MVSEKPNIERVCTKGTVSSIIGMRWIFFFHLSVQGGSAACAEPGTRVVVLKEAYLPAGFLFPSWDRKATGKKKCCELAAKWGQLTLD